MILRSEWQREYCTVGRPTSVGIGLEIEMRCIEACNQFID